ncbi:MAG: phosphoribosylamine--glycine ligase [Acidimicrobiia bacterium]|nr:phosphoribosylamine--glycine ligase [Acidimicrobiia bacterium]
MKVLLVGSGGREHALGWSLTRSDRVDELYSLPGNPGLARLGPIIEGVDPGDVGAVAAIARIHAIDLVVVGPEAPLAAGVVDAVQHLGIPVFGPTRAAAGLEASKAFAKDVMERAGVPTAAAAVFDNAEAAHSHLEASEGPYVVKADGLAAGKGVLVTENREDAGDWVDRCLGGGFGEAGTTVVIEEFLDGPELSVFAVCDGKQAITLEPARDYKRLRDNDQGPNTGGMGSFSPVTLPDGLMKTVNDTVIIPTLRQMAEDGHPYTGFLYVGLVLTDDRPRVLEFNVRLGDPEAQVVLPRLRTDLVDLIEASLDGSLGGFSLDWSDQAAVDVVLAARGYPDSREKGDTITGLGNLPSDVIAFHAGTTVDGDRTIVSGGRVLNIVGMGSTLSEAREKAYVGVETISWPGIQYRSDIAAE